MISKLYFVTLFWALVSVGINGLKIAPSDSRVVLEGRYENIDDRVSFDHPGFKISVKVTGTTEVSVWLSAMAVVPHRFWIYIDGVLSDTVIDTRTMSNDTLTNYLIASRLNPISSYSITLLKITEAQWNALTPEPNYVSFAGYTIDDGAEVLPSLPPLGQHKIEFIGDSIQAGFCDMCSTVDSSYGDYAKESYGAAHPHITCTNLHASCRTAAWSGYGVVRNCCGGSTLMPEIYSRTLASVPGSQWDFSQWLPDVVVINLGDNDGLDRSDPGGELQVSFVATYTDLIRSIAASYKASNPTFFLSCGPMSFGYCPYVQDAIAQVRAEGVPVSYVEFPPFGDPNKRCCGHPSAEAQAQMAAQLTAAITSTMKW